MKTYWILFLALFFCACSSTSIVNSWKNPDSTITAADLSKVVVGVLSTNESARRSAEDYVASLSDKLVPSYSVITKDVAGDQDKMKAAFTAQGYDGALVFRFLDKEKSTTYVPGAYTGGYWGMYGRYWGAYYDPGYYQENTSYTVETSLYSLKEDKLLWSGVTSTVNPSSVEKTMREIVKKSVDRMKKDGVIN